MDAAVRHLIDSCPVLKSFVQVFPEADVGISHYSREFWKGTDMHPSAHATAVTYGRYEVRVAIGCRWQPDGMVEAAGTPEFALSERSRVMLLADGRVSISYRNDTSRPDAFSEAAWWRFVDGKMDWRQLGIKDLNTEPLKPVAGR